MKSLSRSASHCKENRFALPGQPRTLRFDALIVAGSIVVMFTFLFSSCKKEIRDGFEDQALDTKNINAHDGGNALNDYLGLNAQTIWELQQARAHTARYRNIRNAIKDGYADISVVVPNMGHHYMKLALVDGNFEFRKPEILVYNKHENGEFDLVAVEYAVPISATPNVAPAGFTGSADVWDRNTGFGLWLLHAWVWHYNPAGVFNPTNPLIHVHDH